MKSKNRKPQITSKRMNRTEYTGTVNPVRVSYSTLADPTSPTYRKGYQVTGNPDAMIYKMRKEGHPI